MHIHPCGIGIAVALKTVLSDSEIHFDVLFFLLQQLEDDAVPYGRATDFLDAIRALSVSGHGVADNTLRGLTDVRRGGGDGLMTFMMDARRLVGDRADTDSHIDKRSPAGLFLRGLWLDFQNLPYEGVLALLHELSRWTSEISENSHSGDCVHHSRGTETIRDSCTQTTGWESHTSQITDHKIDLLSTRYDAFHQFEIATKAGEHVRAHKNLRRFMDYRFGTVHSASRTHIGSHTPVLHNNQRIVHQQALLNLANLAFEEGGLLEARQALEEAARIARSVVDKDCLAMCKSLASRVEFNTRALALEPYSEPDRLPAAALPPAERAASGDAQCLTAQDELWYIQRDLQQGVPLCHLIGGSGTSSTSSLQKCKMAGHLESLIAGQGETLGNRLTWSKAAWHATAAELFALAAQPHLESLHRLLAFEADATTSQKVYIWSAQVLKSARTGNYRAADNILWDDNDFRSSADLTLKDIIRCQQIFFAVKYLQAERAGFVTVTEEIKRLCPIAQNVPFFTNYGSRMLLPESSDTVSNRSAIEYAHGLLRRAQNSLQSGDLASAIKPIVEVLARTEVSHLGQGLVDLHIRARAMLCYWFVESGESAKALAQMNSPPYLHEIIYDMDDVQLKAEVLRTEGRIKIAMAPTDLTGDLGQKTMLDAAALLEKAAEAALKGGCSALYQQTLSDLAIVHCEIGDMPAARKVAAVWQHAEAGRKQAEMDLLLLISQGAQKLSTWSALHADATSAA